MTPREGETPPRVAPHGAGSPAYGARIMPERRRNSSPALVQEGGLSLPTAGQLEERRKYTHIFSRARPSQGAAVTQQKPCIAHMGILLITYCSHLEAHCGSWLMCCSHFEVCYGHLLMRCSHIVELSWPSM